MSKSLVVRKRTAESQLKSAVKENGSTMPSKLEHKRQKLTGCVKILEESVAAHLATKSDLEKKGLLTDAAKFDLNAAIAQLYAQIAMIEGLGLITDCLSFRLPVKSKSGKSGYTRYSIAGFLGDIDDSAARMFLRLNKAIPMTAAEEEVASAIDEKDRQEDDEEIFEGDVK